MKVLVILLLLTTSLAAQPLTEAWAEGRYLDILEAIDTRLALESAGDDDGPLLHDRGNCLFRLGRHAEAALAYRRSLLRSEGDAETEFNLALSERRLGIVPPGEAGLLAGVRRHLRDLDEGSALLLLVALEVLALFILLIGRRRPLVIALAGLGLVVVLIGAWRFNQDRLGPRGLQAVVLEDRTQLRTEPHQGAAMMVTLQPGALLEVEARSDRWLRVRSGGETGYVAVEEVGLVD